MIPELKIEIPETVSQVIELLNSTDFSSRIIAGGTDIVPGFHINSSRFRDIDLLIDINRIHELKNVSVDDEYFRIGSAVTFSQLQQNEIIKTQLPVLHKAACGVGNKQIRNRATVAGNFINNAPCADSVPTLLVYDSLIKTISASGSKLIELREFLTGPYKTLLNKDELVTEILIPRKALLSKGGFYKLGRRRAVAISRISLALLFDIQDGVFSDFKLASGAVTPIGQRLDEIESFVKGKKPDDELLKIIAIKTGEEVLKITRLRWSSPHKLPVLQRALYKLLQDTIG